MVRLRADRQAIVEKSGFLIFLRLLHSLSELFPRVHRREKRAKRSGEEGCSPCGGAWDPGL